MSPSRLLSVALVLAVLLAAPAGAQFLRIYYPDIEQGSATVVVSPSGQALLVDAGTGLNPTDDDIALFVQDLIATGVITSLDYVVASHYDEDHIGRLEDVLNFGGVSPTVITYDRGDFNGTPSTFAYFDYQAAAETHGRTTITPFTDIDLGGGVVVECYVVNGDLRDSTSVDITGSGQFENSASIGLVVRFGGFDAWIGGDLTGNPAQSSVTDVESAVAALIGDLDLYTVNHHGSKTSSNATFLSAMKAEIVVNQSSVSNNFGHPHVDVVNQILATPDTAGATPLFFQQNPGNPTDDRSDDGLAAGIADPDDVDEVVGLPGTITVRSDGASYQIFGGLIVPVARVADSGSGPLADFPPAILQVSRSPVVPLATEGVTVSADVADEGAATVTLRYWLDDVEQTPIAMAPAGGAIYQATIPALGDGAKVSYRVEAVDALAQSSLSRADGYYSGTTPVSTFRISDADGVLQTTRFDARVEGNLTVEPGVFHSVVTQTYVQDASGGVLVFDRGVLPLERGDQVQFVGEIQQHSGQTELNISASFGNFGHAFVASGPVPPPLQVTVAQVDESLEGRLIRLDGVTVVGGAIPESGNGTLTVSDDGGLTTLTVFIDGDTDIPGATTPSAPFDLIGVAAQFDTRFPFVDGYEIIPRERADFLSGEVNAPILLINELHADPHNDQGDANGDGVRHATDDEFVELVNTGFAPLDISNWTIADEIGVRHTFAPGTVVPPREAVVVFGGGTPTGAFGNAAANGLVFVADSGTLALNNAGDTVTVSDGAGLVVQVASYGSEGGSDESLTRDPDYSNTAFVQHSVAAGSGGSLFSPGTRVDGAAFTVPPGAVLLTEVLYDADGADDGLEWVELFNATSSPIDLSGLSLGSGGSDYTTSTMQLSGTIQPGATFVVGGSTSSTANGNPTFDQLADFSPDLQNSGTDADGVALFNIRAAFVTASTVPIDAVVYGPANTNGLIDETGTANPPEVDDAPSASSIGRIDLEGSWQILTAPDPNHFAPGEPPPPPPSGEGLLLSEVFYDASSADDGLEWVELFNSSDEAIDLSTFSLGNGGADYTSSTVQLSGTIQPDQTFVIGGPTSDASNGSPSFDLEVNFSPDFQNSGADADGVALFNVPASQVSPTTVPIDAVVYGPANTNGLIDETGAANEPEVGDAAAGSSIERIDLAGAWQIQASPTPNASPLDSGGDPTMHVESIVLSTVGGGNKKARARVTIVDASGAAVAGALVDGTFSGDYNESASGTTDAGGEATVDTNDRQKGNVSFTFCVDDVTLSGWTYDPAMNVETCDTF